MAEVPCNTFYSPRISLLNLEASDNPLDEALHLFLGFIEVVPFSSSYKRIIIVLTIIKMD